MPLENELFQLVRSRKYKEALPILQNNMNNPQFDINALNEKGASFLHYASAFADKKAPEYLTFIETLLAHPKFSHAATPFVLSKRTSFAEAVISNYPPLVELFLKYRKEKKLEVVAHQGTLLLATQMQRVAQSENLLQEDPEDEFTQEMLAAQKAICVLLRDVTIRHAVTTDNPDILDTMVRLGDLVYLPLKDGTPITDLTVDEPGKVRIERWLDGYIDQHRDSFSFKMMVLGQQKRCLEEDYRRKRVELLMSSNAQQIKSLEQSAALIHKFFGPLKSSEATSQGQSAAAAATSTK